MGEHLRPLESANIDEGLRRRLEGDVELLEDGTHLLDSLTHAFGRLEPSADDLGTFEECIAELPRLDEALDRASRHDAAGPLVRLLRRKLAAAHEVGNGRLRALGETDQPSLRAATQRLLALVRQQGQAPRPGELRLLESSGAQTGQAVVAGALVALLASGQGLTAALLAGALAGVVASLALPSRPWVLLPDRLYFPPRRGRPSSQIPLGELRTFEGNRVTWAGETIELRGAAPPSVESLLTLLTGLGPLTATPGPYAVLEGRDEENGSKGKVLVAAHGLLFVPDARLNELEAALAGRALEVSSPVDELLAIVAHVPPGRVSALAQRLREEVGATWLPAGAVRVERSEVQASHASVVGKDGRRVRVMLPFGQSEARQAAEVALARLRGG